MLEFGLLPYWFTSGGQDVCLELSVSFGSRSMIVLLGSGV